MPSIFYPGILCQFLISSFRSRDSLRMQSNDKLHIPSGSFTAYRLTYCSPQELSQLARTVFLGHIPNIWADEKSKNIFARATHRSKQSVQHSFRGVVGVIHKSVAAGTSKFRQERSPLFLGHGKLDPETVLHELEAPQHETSTSSASSTSLASDTTPHMFSESLSITPNDTGLKSVLPYADSPTVYRPHSQDLSLVTTPETLSPPKTGRKRISIAEPTPAELDRSEFLRVAEQHKKFKEKLKRFALVSKGHAKRTGSDLRLVVQRRLLTKFSAGQVVRVDKMLVLIKVPHTKLETSLFTENEPCDTRVVGRWKEYHVALRRTDDNLNPLMLQLYDLPLFDETTTKSKPDTSIPLSSSVTAQFYSRLDKTISLWVGGEKPLVCVLACKDHVTSVGWLYFIGQFINQSSDPTFQISIPDLEISLLVHISEVALLKMATKHEELEVEEREYGYKVQKNPLFSYLDNAIHSCLVDNPKLSFQFKQWQVHNPNPWFVHKYYDRLEWAPDNSGLLAMQHQLLRKWYTLEYRQAAHLSSKCTFTKSGDVLEEPYPIEGFLSRLSSISGHSFSLYRTFYKTLYFYSHRGLLFYTKYYRGIPPSVSNPIIHERNETTVATEYNPYPLDENDHIVWLRENFTECDGMAQQEFERKTLQIIKAEGVIDMSRAKSIQPLAIEDVRLTHKVLLATLWYSNPSLATTKEIVDSSFTIEMDSGEIIRLQAPNRDSRDEWVDRLRALREYWVAKGSEILSRIKTTSVKNRTSRKITEYIDSNATEEMEHVEVQHSFADPQIHNIEPLAMKHCVSMYGHLFLKTKMHSNFRPYFVVLSPGFLMIYKTYRRSKLTGASKKSGYFRHFITLPISECYLYSGISCSHDLLDRQNAVDVVNPGTHSLPRVYPDGWKSSEEESLRCFTLTVGEKRAILKHRMKKTDANLNNPGMIKLASKLGITGRSMVFMARSRQEREIWVQRIFCEIDRFAL